MNKLFLLAVALLVGVSAFNPGMREFEAYVEERLHPNMARTVGAMGVTRSVGRDVEQLLAADLPEVTHRRSYVLASTYDVDLDGNGRADYRFLGVASQFVLLHEPGL